MGRGRRRGGSCENNTNGKTSTQVTSQNEQYERKVQKTPTYLD